MKSKVKICGIKDSAALESVVEAGADFVGFVFYPPSPRDVDLTTFKSLSAQAQGHVTRVGLMVDPSDEKIEEILAAAPLDMIQLHGHESPQRVQEVRVRYELPVMKAISVSGPADLGLLRDYEDIADWLLFDAKAPTNSAIPGGNGEAFDWQLLESVQHTKPWMLAGGLTLENVSDALAILSPGALDVSSGVESAKGVKDSAKIRSFLSAVKAA